MTGVVGMVLALGMATAPLQAGDDVSGLWRTPVDGGVVRLTPCGADLCGAIVESARLRADPDQRDVQNLDPAQRARPLKGLRILRATRERPGQWGGGWVYNPEEGKTYRGSLRLLSDGSIQLTGCVVRPFCRTQIWRRLDQ